MTDQSHATRQNWWQRQPKLAKGIIIAIAVIVVLAILGTLTGGSDDDTDATASETTAAQVAETTTPAPEATEEAPVVPEWQTTDDYITWCSTDDMKIDPDLQAAADAVTVPEQGHVQALYLDRTDIIARVCSPIKGDKLARVAEDLATGVRASAIGEQVETMRVKALPNDSDPSARLADMGFQIRLHNGKGDEGAVLSAWKSVDER